MITPDSSNAVKRLIAEGIIPPGCRSMRLDCSVNAAVTMELEVFVTEEQMAKIADALIDNPEEAREFVKAVILKVPGDTPLRVDL